VGLPLAIQFAHCGHSVVSLDVDEDKVTAVNRGEMPFQDKGADEALSAVLKKELFRATTDASAVSEGQILITVVGTPVDEHLSPRFEVMQELLQQYKDRFRPGQLLVMRSTIYPGTTERVRRLVDSMGLELDVAFCPERVAEGVALEEIRTLPQIVAGCTERARERAEELFRTLGVKILSLPPMAAELAKLFTNTWRYIQFAVSNQFYMIANDYGIDFYEVHRAMTEDYPRTRGFPRAGFTAGPCLFKDTMQLSAFHNNNFFLGHAAMLVNEGLPNYLVRRMAARFPLPKMTAGILGMTFKADSDDLRDSLAMKLRSLLQAECRDVLCADPHLEEPWIRPVEEVVEKSDLLFLGAPHKIFTDIDLQGKPLVDIWNVRKERMDIL
jgi:UDP-N-acetyl-D-mannosaminuronic acid dehydrogenase